MPRPDLEFAVDASKAIRTIDRRVRGMFPAAREAFEESAADFVAKFRSARMSGRKGGVGLYKRSGALRAALTYKVTGDRLDRLRMRVGWLAGGLLARIAVVHEYGATIYGRPWLIFRLLGPRGGDYGWKKVHSVKIPARLEFRKHWRAYQSTVTRNTKAALKEVVENG